MEYAGGMFRATSSKTGCPQYCNESVLPSYDSGNYEYVNGCITMYLVLPEDLTWDLYDLASISVWTQLDRDNSEKHSVNLTENVAEIQSHWEYGIYDKSLDDHLKKGFIIGMDSEGTELWIHSTSARADMGQFSGIKEIGFINNNYYYFDNGSIVALNAKTGDLLWKRSDFDAVLGAWDVNTEGLIFLSGVYEPDLFIINEKGKFLKRVEVISEEYPYVTKVHAKNDHVVVAVDSYWDGGICRYFIDLNDYSCTPLSET